MEIRLLDLNLQNFKGIQAFQLHVEGKNAFVDGDNATGKTTLNDAWKWLLFDKDSANRSDFTIKTIDQSTGEEMHFLEHMVEGKLTVDGQPRTLKKMMKENWVTRKGEQKQSYDGNVYSYWIDDVPVKKSEYVSEIGKIIDEKIFRLITDPFYANDVMKWSDLRDVLIELAGDVSIQDVISTDKKLAILPSILENRTTDKHKAMIKEQIKKYMEEKKGIPPRIDELSKTIEGGLNVDYTAIETEKADCERLLQDLERKIASGSSIVKRQVNLNNELFKAQSDLSERKMAIEKEANAGVRNLSDEKAKLDNEQYRLKTDNSTMEIKVTGLKNTLDMNEKLLNDLRKQFDEVDSQVFPEPDIDTVCPTCGQAIPDDQIRHKHQDMKKKFLEDKNKKLDDIESSGIAIKKRNEQQQSEMKEILSKVEVNKLRIKEISERITSIDKEISATDIAIDYGRDPLYVTLENDIKHLQEELAKPVEDATEELIQAKNDLVAQIDDYKRTLNSKETNEKNKARIQELKQQEQDLAQKVAELEGQDFLIDTFVKTKANLMEAKINKCFQHVTFKLFDQNQNGSVDPCCITLIKGVPWKDANHEGRTNGGLDIINTLTNFYKVHAPIFIDYRESVNKLIPTDSQVINLRVTNDKSLTVEVEE